MDFVDNLSFKKVVSLLSSSFVKFLAFRVFILDKKLPVLAAFLHFRACRS